jgi:putative serine protease PepD
MRRLAALALAALTLAGCGGDTGAPPPAAAPAASATATPDVVQRVLPSVVNVRVEGPGRSGQGSGVVLEGAGTILTNYHVVEGASRVSVAFNDGRHRRPLPGEVVGSAPERDLAVIRVDADDLVPIEVGRSSELRLGDSVLTLGFPLGLGPTVTQGIVSGLERTIEPRGGPRLEGLLQTDAAVNPGNSGGALVDGRGRLVGINTAGAAGFAENVGFAIPIDEARGVVDQILGEPREGRAWLGLSLDLALAGGALVTAVSPGSPAAVAGLDVGDVIIGIDGRDVHSPADVNEALADLEPGEEADLEVRGERAVRVTLGRAR